MPTAALFLDAVEDGEEVVLVPLALGVVVVELPADWLLLPGWLI